MVGNLPPSESVKSRDAVGRAIGASSNSIDQASRVLKQAMK